MNPATITVSPGSSDPGSVEAEDEMATIMRLQTRGHRGLRTPAPLKPGPRAVPGARRRRSPGSSDPGSVEATSLRTNAWAAGGRSPGSSDPGSVEAMRATGRPHDAAGHRGLRTPAPLKREEVPGQAAVVGLLSPGSSDPGSVEAAGIVPHGLCLLAPRHRGLRTPAPLKLGGTVKVRGLTAAVTGVFGPRLR